MHVNLICSVETSAVTAKVQTESLHYVLAAVFSNQSILAVLKMASLPVKYLLGCLKSCA